MSVEKTCRFGKWLYYVNDEGKARWKCSECGKICHKDPAEKNYCSRCGFYCMDCMEGMKQFPDGFFDLAIVDPPYGGGFTEGGGCKGWFAKYHPDGKNIGGGTIRRTI